MKFFLSIENSLIEDVIKSSQEFQRKIELHEILAEDFIYFGGLLPVKFKPIFRKKVGLRASRMSIASHDWDEGYIAGLQNLIAETQAQWVSFPLCFSRFNGVQFHFSLPVIYSPKSLRWMIERVKELKQKLQVPLVIENVAHWSQDLHYYMHETKYLTELATETNSLLALDLLSLKRNCDIYGEDYNEALMAVLPKSLCVILRDGFYEELLNPNLLTKTVMFRTGSGNWFNQTVKSPFFGELYG